MRNDCTRVGRRCGGGTEKHSGSRAAVTSELTDGRTRADGRMDGWVGGISAWCGHAVEGGGVR